MTSKEFIYKFRKKLESGPDFFNPDTCLQTVEDYEKAKCRILVVFPTPHFNKTVSSTAAALNDYVIEHCPDCFIDFAYMPEPSDTDLYDRNNMPYAIGNITHLDASHFDFVGFSISVLSDIISAPCMLKTFDRCDTPIPLFWSDRKDLPLGKCPIIFEGGITAIYSDISFGKVGDKTAFLDFMYLGECDKLNVLFNRYIEAKETHKVTRSQEDHYIYGCPPNDNLDLILNAPCNTIQDFIDLQFDCSWIYQPQAYEVKFNKSRQIISNHKINPLAQDFVTPYYPHKLPNDLSIGRTILNANGDMAGTAQTVVSNGCSASGSCSFCSEGNVSGGWVEKSKEEIIKDCWESKKYSAAWKYKPYSFNSNYLTDYKGMLKEFMKIFPKVSFINMRMEELGRDIDALHIINHIGSNRMAAPLEGLSPRIQNNLLNKCLSTESLTNFMEDMVHARIMDLKVGAIYTGYEEDEDFQFMYDFISKMKKKAADENARFPIRLNTTPLVHYPLTPIEYLERKTAFRSFNQQRWFTDEWYNKFFDINARIKVHGFRYSTFIEQSILDLGRSLTPMIYKHFVSKSFPVYSLRTMATPEFVDELKAFIDPSVHFADRDPEHYISPCHRIHIEMFGSYVPRARRLLRHKKAGNVFDNEPDIRCLKTYEGAKVKCYHNCIKDDPLKVYYDVDMDENHELHGKYYELKGCTRCYTPEERKQRLARPLPQSATLSDIIATPKLPLVQKIRFVLHRNPEFDILNPNNTAYSFLTKFLQNSDELLHAYHSVSGHSMFWQTEPAWKYQSSGIQIVDTFWTKDVYNTVQSLIEKVNSQLKSVKVLSASIILNDEKVAHTDYCLYYFESSIQREIFDAAKMNYKGEIRIDGGTGAAIMPIEHIDSSLKVPVFVSKGKVCGCFALPLKYNPVVYMSAFLTTGYKTSFEKVMETTTFESLMVVRENLSVCSCGKEHATISLLSGKAMPFGLDCLKKAILQKKVK